MPNWKIQQLFYVKEKLCHELKNQRELTLKLFEHLIDHTIKQQMPMEEPPLTTESVMTFIYGDSQKHRENFATNLRALKADLKACLAEFASSGRGRRLPFSIHVKDESWNLRVEEQACALKRFWAPYFEECDLVNIVYGENVFFRTGEDMRLFVRHLDVNEENDFKTIQSQTGLP